MQLGVMFGGMGMMGGPLGSIAMLGLSSALSLIMGHKSHNNTTKLNDLKVSSSTYGKGIPIVYGTMRVTGNMIWATDLIQTTDDTSGKKKAGGGKDGGKRGGDHTVYIYHGNFAMALCEGPIENILRIWADSNLIYDQQNPNGYYDTHGVLHAVVAPGFSVTQNADGTQNARGGKDDPTKGTSAYDGTFTPAVYIGDESQEPDPFIQQTNNGQGLPCTAFRGLAYLVFTDFPLKDFGNRIPTITAEVVCKHGSSAVFNPFTLLAPQPLVAGADNPPFVTQTWAVPFVKGWVDYFRNRVYTLGVSGDPTAYPGGKILRVWDFADSKEIAQLPLQNLSTVDTPILLPENSALSGGVVSGTGVHDIVGVTATGDLMGVDIQAPSTILWFINPFTYTVEYAYGRIARVYQGDTHGQFAYPIHAALVGTTSMNTTNAGLQTAVTSKRGALAVLDGNDAIQGILPTIDQNSFRTLTGNPTADAPTLYVQGESHEPGNSYSQITQLPITTLILLPQQRSSSTDGGKTIKYVPPDPNEALFTGNYNSMGFLPDEFNTDVGCSPAFHMLGASCIALFLYKIGGPSEGVYVFKMDYDLHPTWQAKISDDPTVCPTRQNLPGMVFEPTPMIADTVFQFLDADGTMYQIDFQAETVVTTPNDTINCPLVAGQAFFGADNGVLYVGQDPNQAGQETLCLARFAKGTSVNTSLTEILEDLADRCNIKSSRVDDSAMTSIDMTGYIIENPVEAKNVIEDLTKIYFFDVIESDKKVKMIPRHTQSLANVPQSDLGVIENTSEKGVQEHWKETVIQEIDLPRRVTLSFIDATEEYQNGTQSWSRPTSPVPILQTKDTLDLNFPISMTNDDAKNFCQVALTSIWAERTTHEFVLPWNYLMYDAADVLTFNMDDGEIFQDRLTKIEVGADFSLRVTAASLYGDTYNANNVAGRTSGSLAFRQAHPPLVVPWVIDGPLLRNSDYQGEQTLSIYWGAKALGPGFQRAALQCHHPDRSVSFVGVSTQELVWGRVKGAIPDPPNGPFATDDQSVLTLHMNHDFSSIYTWESIPDDQWPSDKNQIWAENEILYFKNAKDNGDGTVTIDTLLRARRGTDDWAYGHTLGAEWVLLQRTRIKMTTIPYSDILGYTYFRYGTSYPLQVFAPGRQCLFQGRTLQPYSPQNLTLSVNGDGDCVIEWTRRTRVGGNLVAGTAYTPLNEATELYNCYVLHEPNLIDVGDPGTYAFTAQVTEPKYVLKAADRESLQLGDGPLNFAVFQMNDLVGFGIGAAHSFEQPFAQG